MSRITTLLGGGAVAASLAALTLAVWPASETDKARDDGERVGAAVAQVQSAETAGDAADARIELADAVQQTRDHGYDDFESAVYEAELDAALDDLDSRAGDFRATGPEVQQAFWDGYATGVES
jgi:hypothetical protein